MTTKSELLALADALEGNVKHWSLTVTMPQASAALREYAATMDAEPVAWLAAYVNSDGLPDVFVTTHRELAIENDANRSPKPLYLGREK